MDAIAKLEARRAEAEASGDTETAELLADAIARLKAGDSPLREQQPGRMGLGTSQESYRNDPTRPLPKKPDPMTKGHKPGGRRSR
ncbi:MAG: excinuclease ABC subunit B [Proteobacteria bacterium]|nr:excinuclease ABC subunit B [Pseudomonadota bacterium]